MRHRIRETASVDYQRARSNEDWPDHRARALVTAGILAWLKPRSVFDPSCGDGSIVLAADALHMIDEAVLADVSAPSIRTVDEQIRIRDLGLETTGLWTARVEDAGTLIDIYAGMDAEKFDVIVLTEFLEHVPNPDWILSRSRDVAHRLVASSPLIESPHGDDGNPEHLWAFDNQGYADMLEGAGWRTETRMNLMFRDYPYTFQIWVART